MYNEFENEIWESLLKTAVIENSLNEIKDYPSEKEINSITLPNRYDLKMRKIIKHCQHYKNAEIFLQNLKKIASIILLIMGISFSVLLSSEKVRAACRNVIIEIYDSFIRYTHISDLSSENLPVNFGYIPAGFFISEISSNGIDNFVIYQNTNKDYFELNYGSQKYTSFIDNEHYSISNVGICDVEGTFFESQDERFANILIWDTENSYFQLKSTLKKEEILKIAENLK